MNRRTFVLRTVLATGALGLGWALLPPPGRLGDGDDLPTDPDAPALNGWVRIGTDGVVTIMMAKSEMGQGIHTTLAMLLADELDADWSMVRTEPAPVLDIYNNVPAVLQSLPFRPDDEGVVRRTAEWLTAKVVRGAGEMITGGSTSTNDLWLPMREAGASARAMLVTAAARQWNVPPGEVTVERGVVRHAASGRRTGFGALVTAAAALDVPTHVTLKTPAQFRIIGTSTPRLDAPAKQHGTATFGIDVTLPDLHYASVIMCPVLGGTVERFDGAAALRLPGVKQVVLAEGLAGGTQGIAAIADTPWHAMRAAQAVTVTWQTSGREHVSSQSALETLQRTLKQERGVAYHARGDVAAALASAATRVTAEYRVPYLAHAAMEPINCTVLYARDRATVWVSTQVPGLARRAAAHAMGLDTRDVEVRVQYVGGAFGRRLEVDYVAQAAAIAKRVPGTPVQVLWSREEDVRHDFYRPACVARYDAALDPARTLTAWSSHSASQSVVNDVLHRYFNTPGLPLDRTTLEGAFDQPYAFPAIRAAHSIVALPIPVGYWRSVGYSHTTFFTESFMDEVAHAAGADPVAFRLTLLGDRPRHAAVLQRVSAMAAQGGPQAPREGVRTGRGVALHESYGSVTAQVAEVEVRADDTWRVTRVWCAIDCGVAVHPGMIRQQVEGGIVFGLSAALHGEITIRQGRVQQGNFSDYPVLRLHETPDIVVEIMPSDRHPSGVGEPPVPPVAPAVANALFAATGRRLRSLPLRFTEAS